ncbi:MAG: hypothetical protein IPG69_03010 [Flavobacteriales bacterium]|nr:hypothetical protein [Flavobacteriales bacterium]
MGNTNNQFPTLPVNACPFPNSPVSGGSFWYSCTPVQDENVIVSTCGASTCSIPDWTFTPAPAERSAA